MNRAAKPVDRRGKAAAPRRRPPARVRGPARRASIGAQIGRAMRTIPLPAAVLRRVRDWTLALLLIGGVAAGLMAMGVPQMAGLAAAHAIGAAGFTVKNIDVQGITHVDRDAIYRVAQAESGQDMPLVDLAATRAALLGLGWVKDARVSRRLPDTLAIDIVERKPAAIWQYQQRLNLIEGDGTVIAPVNGATIPDQLPLVIGPEANAHAAELAALVTSQPSLKPLVEGANWIGGRRWDIRFQSGETLALPEGEAQAKAALAEFAHRDSQTRLLGQGYVRFDMRDGDKMVVRMSREPGARIDKPDTPPPAATAKPGAPAPAPKTT